VTAAVAADPAFDEVDHGLLRYVDTIIVDSDPYAMPITKAIYFDAGATLDEIRAEFTTSRSYRPRSPCSAPAPAR
jgi:hypothetical protein